MSQTVVPRGITQLNVTHYWEQPYYNTINPQPKVECLELLKWIYTEGGKNDISMKCMSALLLSSSLPIH